MLTLKGFKKLDGGGDLPPRYLTRTTRSLTATWVLPYAVYGPQPIGSRHTVGAKYVHSAVSAEKFGALREPSHNDVGD